MLRGYARSLSNLGNRHIDGYTLADRILAEKIVPQSFDNLFKTKCLEDCELIENQDHYVLDPYTKYPVKQNFLEMTSELENLPMLNDEGRSFLKKVSQGRLPAGKQESAKRKNKQIKNAIVFEQK